MAVCRFLACSLLLMAVSGCETPSSLPAPLEGISVRLERLVGGLDHPVWMTHAGDGSGRLFVLEQPGRIRIVQDGAMLERPFLDVSERVGEPGFEQGLLGLAFAPDYGSSGKVYVSYTDQRGDSVLARYRVEAVDPNRVDPDSAQIILTVGQPAANHNGGHVLFGPDGYLYFGLGDGGGVSDPEGNGQNTGTLLGALLRIDVTEDEGYGIPPDNPFVHQPAARGELWAYGLRNPWRFAFDGNTGDLYIGDVGEHNVEEINYLPGDSPHGANFGWSLWEGSRRQWGGSRRGLVFPVAEYTHESGRCSVIGGHVYHGQDMPGMSGAYIYGDFCSGDIWLLHHRGDAWHTSRVMMTGFPVSSFGEGPAGELYVLDYRGAVWRVLPR